MAIAGRYNDEPTLTDLIGRGSLVKTIGDEIASCQAPQVFGIHGDWGSGKTTFLHLLHFYLTGECPESQGWTKSGEPDIRAQWPDWKKKENVCVVSFEAWRYQYEPNPIVALLQEIRTQLQSTWRRIGNAVKKEVEVGLYGALFGMESLTKYLGVSAAKVQEAGERWEKDHYATQLPTHVIRGLLEKAIGQLLGGKKPNKKLVILVDDLDRCEGECVYRLLEGIKIYLSIPNCVFVLGMDQQIVELSVAKHINAGNAEDQRLLAREYVEKICRNIWYLPLLSEPAGLLSRILGAVPGAQSICDVVKAYKCLPANPRKIKAFAHVVERFVNELGYSTLYSRAAAFVTLPETFAHETKEDLDPVAGLIVVMASLYIFHPESYRTIEGHPMFYQRVLDWASGNRTSDRRLSEIHLLRERPEDAGRGATPNTEALETAFADPMRGFIFRVQDLMIDLGEGVTVDAIQQCLLGNRV